MIIPLDSPVADEAYFQDMPLKQVSPTPQSQSAPMPPPNPSTSQPIPFPSMGQTSQGTPRPISMPG